MEHAAREAWGGRTLERCIDLVAADGTRLGATVFEPEGPPRATVVIHGATATPARYYRRFAEHLAASGLLVLTYDYRGVGRSRPPSLRGFRASMSDWALLDARAALSWAREHALGGPIVFVGHSFGGQILGLVDEARDVAGAVLVAAQLGYYGHWPAPSRWKLAVIWHALVPSFTKSLGYVPGSAGIGEDLPAGVAEEWARWCRHPDYLIGYDPAARERFARFDRPTLLFSFSDDEDFAPRGSVRALLAVLSSARVAHRRVAPAEVGGRPIGHFGFFRERFAATLWRDALEFIDALAEGRGDEAARRAARTGGWGITEDDVMADLAYGRA